MCQIQAEINVRGRNLDVFSGPLLLTTHCEDGHDQPVLSTGRAETVAGRGGWGWGDRVSSGRRERTGGEHRVMGTDRCDTQARGGHAHNSAVGQGRADQDDEMVSSLLRAPPNRGDNQ